MGEAQVEFPDAQLEEVCTEASRNHRNKTKVGKIQEEIQSLEYKKKVFRGAIHKKRTK